MKEIEKLIKDKISELENCLKDVANEVRGAVCHWEYDDRKYEESNWSKERLADSNFQSSHFYSVNCHIKEEMKSLYMKVRQNLKDSANKIGQRIEYFENDYYDLLPLN